MQVGIHHSLQIDTAHSDRIDPISLEPIPLKYLVKLQNTYLDARYMADYAIATGVCMHPYSRQILTCDECDVISAALDDIEQIIAFEDVKLSYLNDTIRTLLAMQRTVGFLSMYSLLLSQGEDAQRALSLALQHTQFTKRETIKACLNTHSTYVKKALIESLRNGDQYTMTKVSEDEMFRVLKHEYFDALVVLIGDYSQTYDYLM